MGAAAAGQPLRRLRARSRRRPRRGARPDLPALRHQQVRPDRRPGPGVERARRPPRRRRARSTTTVRAATPRSPWVASGTPSSGLRRPRGGGPSCLTFDHATTTSQRSEQHPPGQVRDRGLGSEERPQQPAIAAGGEVAERLHGGEEAERGAARAVGARAATAACSAVSTQPMATPASGRAGPVAMEVGLGEGEPDVPSLAYRAPTRRAGYSQYPVNSRRAARGSRRQGPGRAAVEDTMGGLTALAAVVVAYKLARSSTGGVQRPDWGVAADPGTAVRMFSSWATETTHHRGPGRTVRRPRVRDVDRAGRRRRGNRRARRFVLRNPRRAWAAPASSRAHRLGARPATAVPAESGGCSRPGSPHPAWRKRTDVGQ